MSDNIKLITQNKKARFEYFIIDTYEAGIVLSGTEVKSLRLGKVSFIDSYAMIEDGEAFIEGLHISPYEKGNIFNKEPLRRRKLLLHKAEIMKMIGLRQREGYTLIPLKIYFKNGKAKLEIGVAKGKKLYDKRQDTAKRDAKREIDKRIKMQSRE
jgi:SsrA-binding protein